VPHEIVLTEHEAGQRLDRYLRKLLRTMPLGAIFKHLRSGAIKVDGKRADGDLRLEQGMRIELRLPTGDIEAVRAAGNQAAAGPAPPARSVAAGVLDQAPRIVRTDDQILVVAKPPGLAVHAGSGQKFTLVDWLKAQRLGVRTGTFSPAPAHRLDRGTSGLLVIGLTPDALRSLTASFRAGEVDKVYHAIVHGVPERRVGAITASLEVADEPDRRDAKVVVDPGGRPARTEYEVIRTTRHLSLLRVIPHEGRQHQIRAHLSHIGHPIVGDNRYGSVADTSPGFLLHCSELSFTHPRTQQRVHFSDPLPKRFLDLLADE
jgi:23S rRNA pseudouridine955/2504/2580 synthase